MVERIDPVLDRGGLKVVRGEVWGGTICEQCGIQASVACQSYFRYKATGLGKMVQFIVYICMLEYYREHFKSHRHFSGYFGKSSITPRLLIAHTLKLTVSG